MQETSNLDRKRSDSLATKLTKLISDLSRNMGGSSLTGMLRLRVITFCVTI